MATNHMYGDTGALSKAEKKGYGDKGEKNQKNPKYKSMSGEKGTLTEADMRRVRPKKVKSMSGEKGALTDKDIQRVRPKKVKSIKDLRERAKMRMGKPNPMNSGKTYGGY